MSELSKHEGPRPDEYEIWRRMKDGRKKVWVLISTAYSKDSANAFLTPTTETRIAVVRSTRTFLSASPEPEMEK